MKESLNEKVFNKVVQIFSCGSSNFDNQEDEVKIIEQDSPDFGLERRSIHFSMMLDHLQKL